MPYFLELEHIEDDDADYFAFSTLESAIDYLKSNLSGHFVLSDVPVNLPETEYTFSE